MSEDKEIQDAKVFAVVAYLGILCIIPLLLKKENKFALFHGKQGLVLFVIEVGALIFSVIPFLGVFVAKVAFFFCGLASLWGIVNSLLGRYSRIIIIAEVADKITL